MRKMSVPPRETCDQVPVRAVRQRAWLDHLRIISELPHPSLMLMPSLVALIRERLAADMGCYGWVKLGGFEPEAFWIERITESAFRWFRDNYRAVFDELPIRMVAQTDGDIVREMTQAPEYVNNPMHVHVFSSYGVRWVCGLPMYSATGIYHGCLYFYRAESQAHFSEADQAWLRRVRTAIGALDAGSGPYRSLPPAPRQPLASARLIYDRQGRLRSRADNALPMLFLANGPRIGVIDWAGFDLGALPEPLRGEVQRWVAQPGLARARHWKADTEWGRFEFSADPMRPVVDGSDELQWLVTITYLEPQDLTLARRLVSWPLSPKEKRILIASTRDASLNEVAAALQITLGSLKSYVNGLLQRHGAHSRGDLIERILRTEAPGDRLIA